MIYLWTEDSTSGFEFWKFMCKYNINLPIEVESKKNAGKLVRSVEKLFNSSPNSSDIYLIALDLAKGNADAERHRIALANIEAKSNNIFILGINSFEEILLSFKDLAIYCDKATIGIRDKLLDTALSARESYIKGVLNSREYDANSVLNDIGIILNYKYTSLEKLAEKILRIITKGTGFSVHKKAGSKDDNEKFGKCWFCDCCILPDVDCDINLDESSKSQYIFNNSLLKDEFNKFSSILNQRW